MLRHRSAPARVDQSVVSSEFLAQVEQAAFTGERSGRRLAARVSETVGAASEISSSAADAYGQTQALLRQVENGASAVQEIRAAIESLEAHIERQNRLIEESHAAALAMTERIERVASIITQRKESSDQLQSLTENGAEKLRVSEQVVDEVSTKVSSVASLLKIINGIAAKTNLLAMNAAIEAAHAGTYGKGFAVVATEIRSLAENTGSQAKNIASELASLEAGIGEAQNASTEAHGVFDAIDRVAGLVASAFDEISAASNQLREGAGQVEEASSTVLQVASETKQSMAEMTAGAVEIQDMLVSGQEMAAATEQAMGAIDAATSGIARSNSEIGELTAVNNEEIAKLLSAIGELAGHGKLERAAARRLVLSNVMLRQVAWLSSVKVVLGRSESGLREHPRPPIADWLAAGTGDMLESSTAGVVAQLSERITNAFDGIRDSHDEHAFSRLISASNEAIEVLSGSFEDDSLVWTEDLSVRVPLFDEHHQRLFALIGKLFAAMRDGKAKEALETVFDELLEYTVYHFDAEERAFAAFDYPNAERHIDFHRKLVAQARELRSDLAADKPLVAVDVMEFLRDWIINHIKGQDMQYSAFLEGRAIDQTTVVGAMPTRGAAR